MAPSCPPASSDEEVGGEPVLYRRGWWAMECAGPLLRRLCKPKKMYIFWHHGLLWQLTAALHNRCVSRCRRVGELLALLLLLRLTGRGILYEPCSVRRMLLPL